MNYKKLSIGLIVFLIAAVLVSGALASETPPRRDFTEEPAAPLAAGDYYIIAFKDPAAARYTGGIPGLGATKVSRGRFDPNSPASQAYLRHLQNEHANYHSWLARNASGVEVVDEYFITLNAMAVKLNGARPEALSRGPGVRTVAPSVLYRPVMNVSTGLIQALPLWSQAGGQENAGSGIKVGIIDTGIDDSHPIFDCKTGIEHKVYASGVAFDTTNILVEDHGTHVAGTVAGCVTNVDEVAGSVSGVAPGAELWDYNVFPGFGAGYVAFGGSAFSHDIAAALEDAVQDGMHVVNMSLGGTVQGLHDFLAEAVDGTVEAGVVVAVAAGNSGPGDMTVESPGSAPGALTAGASTNPHFLGIPVSGNSQNGNFSYGAALGDFDNFTAFTADYTVTTPANGCTAISEDLTGKVALIDRGVCTFGTKVRNAEAKGALGVLVVNNSAGDPTAMGHDGGVFPTIPAAMLGTAEGNAIKPSGSVTFTGAEPSEVISANADIIAGFSSRGPTPFSYLIKPDVTAPGVNIYSSVFDGQYAMFQGTSMATPHLAGSAALLLDLNPGWTPADVKSALVNTAERVVTDHITATSDPGVLARGGGRINLADANSTPALVNPASASFGYWSGNKAINSSMALEVRSSSGAPLTCSVLVTGSDLLTASPGNFTATNQTITLSLNAGTAQQTGSGDYSGDVILDCSGTELRVPWWVRINRQGKP